MNQPRKPPRRRVDGVLLLDKPAGLTSNAALQKAKWLFNAAKAGHTGTLDPMATGLLPLCFGEATKFAAQLLTADKCYAAVLRLGVRTDTADAEGRVLETRPVPALTQQQIEAVLARFRGRIHQVPPMHSALKHQGRPLYDYARAGVEIERQEREVTIRSLTLRGFEADSLAFDVDCSKGTYIRVLAEDIGAALGCGAHLTALRRTRIGSLHLAEAITPAALEALPLDARDALLRPVDALLAALPRLDLDEAATRRFIQGQTVSMLTPEPSAAATARVYAADGRFLGLGRHEAGLLAPARLVAGGAE
ncbi:MAG: tRNA pseudouridine(55) synthase TruB [Zoogloeaceae bacterium]|jgi:tRNA pseudouridine55 synthase|nr:tRNA pseudouridine(55) synthase TruB [Zoogloeaceae bacterium]